MLIISDDHQAVVNSDNVFVFQLSVTNDGTDVLLAYGPGINTVLAGLGDRPLRALDAIVEAKNVDVLDLSDLLGPRPNLAVAKIALPPNGGKILGRE
jgi:hypothetical protein